MRTLATYSISLILCLGLFISCNSYLPAKTEEFVTADLLGMVYDQHNQSCPGVTVAIDGGSEQLTDINGRFTLLNVSRGHHTLTIKKSGYEPGTFAIDYMNRSQIVYLKIISLNQLLELAEAAMNDRKLDQAEGYLTRAAAIDAAHPLLLFLQASLALKRDQIKEAAAILLSLIEQQTAEAPVYLALADIYEYKEKDTAKALTYLKKYGQMVESDEVKARIKNLEGK